MKGMTQMAEEYVKKNFKKRINFNHFNNLQFKESFRISAPGVEILLVAIAGDLAQEARRNHALSPREQLLTAHCTGTVMVVNIME